MVGGENFDEPYTVHVKEKLENKLKVSAYAKYIFGVSVNIREENFGKQLTIHQICQFSPTKIFFL